MIHQDQLSRDAQVQIRHVSMSSIPAGDYICFSITFYYIIVFNFNKIKYYNII